MSEPTAVVIELEQESNAPTTGTMRIPKEKVKWIEYLLEKTMRYFVFISMMKFLGFYYVDTYCDT